MRYEQSRAGSSLAPGACRLIYKKVMLGMCSRLAGIVVLGTVAGVLRKLLGTVTELGIEEGWLL